MHHRRRPPRYAIATAALVVGLGAGYSAGDRRALPLRAGTASPTASAVPAPTATLSSTGSAALSQDTTAACSAQTGQELQLGVEVTNQSAVAVVFQSARSVLSLGGLKQASWQWAPCGALPGGPGQTEETLKPGQSTWLTATFKVEQHCPAASPVQFTVAYLLAGHPATAALPGFPNLRQIPYNGCPITDNTSGGLLNTSSRWREPATG